ncbi:transposase, partial [Bradyrhizobium sp.]|uniref:transposase n=1 Tax=Bradyrhizobium sp. TaxID=376 RepID=UPI003C602DF5
MHQDSHLPFDLPAVARKKVSIAFDGGMLSSNAGVLLLRGVEQRLGIAARLAACVTDHRDPNRIDHTLVEMLRLRVFAIAAGYEDANDCTTLRQDPVFKMAIGRAPESGEPLCSQPTMSRLENAPSRTEIARMMGAMVDLFCASWKRAP